MTQQLCTNRPGEFIITDKALSFCEFPQSAKILDLGCGSGATVDFLIKKYRFNAYGLDRNLALANGPGNLINAFAEEIPFPSLAMDGVIMECSFSLMDDQAVVLKECFRVLKANGYLIISDMYARGQQARLNGCLGHINTKANLIATVEDAGFAVELFEDYSHLLQAMWGQLIFEKGAESFYCDLGVTPETMKQIRCGYCLIVAKKRSIL